MQSLTSSQAASSNYAFRPKDERFPSLAALVDYKTAERAISAERVINLKDLTTVAAPYRTDAPQSGPKVQMDATGVALQNRATGKIAHFTHYAFGQLCRTLGAPASYLREALSPQLAAQCLAYGMEHSTAGETVNLLMKQNGHGPIVRACTSETYARVWSGELYAQVLEQFRPGDPGSRWATPPTWSGEPAGVYAGDRDDFVIITNGGSLVNDPSGWKATTETGDAGGPEAGGLYRGIMLRNSEVGHCSIVIETVLFRRICGNHILWGAAVDKTFRRRHVKPAGQVGTSKLVRDVVRELNTLAIQYTTRSAKADEQLIARLTDLEIANTKEAVIDELKALKMTKEQAEAAYLACETRESISPRGYWGLSQGITRISQATGHQDTRLQLDTIAAQLLKKGLARVTV